MDEPQSTPELHRTMGFFDVLLFVVIATFGIVGFAKAGEDGPVGITLWIVGGLTFYLPLAMAVIVLSARYPGEGGLALWSQRAFGDFAGFMTGWMYWTSNLPFLPGLLYFIAGSVLFVDLDRWKHLVEDPTYFCIVSLLCLGVATALNIVGLDIGKWLHNAGALGTWLPALGLVALAFVGWAEYGPATDLSAAQFVPNWNVKQVVAWPVLIMSLVGLEAASIMGSEIKNPRQLPVALIVAAVLVIITNVLCTLAMLVALPPSGLGGAGEFMQAFDAAATRAGVVGWVPLIAILVVIGYLGKVGAWSAACARLALASGMNNVLPAALTKIHPRWGTPYLALLIQAAAVAVLVFVGQAGTTAKGAFNAFLNMTVIPTLIPFLYVFAAVIKVQRAIPGPGRMRTALGRWLAILVAGMGFITTACAMVLAVIPPPEQSDEWFVAKVAGVAAVLIGSGVAIYWLGKGEQSTV